MRKWNERSLKERAAEVLVKNVEQEGDLRRLFEVDLPKTLLPLLEQKLWHREYFFFWPDICVFDWLLVLYISKYIQEHFLVFKTWAPTNNFLDASQAPTPVSLSMDPSFRFPLLSVSVDKTLTERLWIMGCCIFSESYDQQLSDFDFLVLYNLVDWLGMCQQVQQERRGEIAKKKWKCIFAMCTWLDKYSKLCEFI